MLARVRAINFIQRSVLGSLYFTVSEMYVAAYTYASPEPGDLSFVTGEVITVTKKEADWWTGYIGDRTGIFPANYVTEYEGEAELEPEVVPAVEEPPPQEQQPQQQQQQSEQQVECMQGSSVTE